MDFRMLRNVAGCFATGVTILATRAGDGVHSMTASSFLSVSLSPPLVLFSLANHCKMNGLLQPSHGVGISILAEGQENISEHFANRGRLEESVFTRDAIPLIDNAHAVYRVTIKEVVSAGDHQLFICDVMHAEHRHTKPLIFYRGKYATVQPCESGV